MSKKLHLAFVWHMHQPYYRNDIEGKTIMPWVFLHGIKDYYDIPWYMSRFEGVKATYNLVPSLIEQLKLYIEGRAGDALLDALYKEVVTLNIEEKKLLESYLFLSNEKNMIKPLSRYYTLFLKYSSHGNINDFDEGELLDGQVLFLLAWCGVYLRQNSDTVKRLLEKGAGYTQNEKKELLDALLEFVKEIVPFYKKLEENGQITLITTPYYHPITPLLLDRESAREARPDVTLPKSSGDFYDFGERNTKDAVSFFEENFQKKPEGFWPAEGSVSMKSANLFAKYGIKWFCSDEEILYKTLHNDTKHNIYKNYSLDTEEGSVEIRFRDKYLSDLLGFQYSNRDPKDAANDFIHHLKNIYEACDFSPLVNVILDGENAWEFYTNNGYDFFMELYKQFEACDWIEPVKMEEFKNQEDIKTTALSNLASGSWISGNFDIWIGQEEKNRAWELLDMTKRAYDGKQDSLEKEKKEIIDKEFMIALGSDWFWWYGDDHYTVQKAEFDALFRKHLTNIYNLMDMEVPKEIVTPIVQEKSGSSFHRKPKDLIYPTMDGKESDYFEWLNSGVIDLKKEFSVMDSSKNYIESIRYGYNENSLFFFMDGKVKKLAGKAVLNLNINGKTYPLELKERVEHKEVRLFLDKHIEIEIDRKIIEKSKFGFSFTLFFEEKEVQTFPLYDEFTIEIENLKLKNWYV